MARSLVRIPEHEAPFPVPAGSIVFWAEPLNGGFAYEISFGNGRGASIIQNARSYGGSSKMWELAVLRYADIDYTTPITGDVLGWLDEREVADLLVRIHALPHVSGSNHSPRVRYGSAPSGPYGD